MSLQQRTPVSYAPEHRTARARRSARAARQQTIGSHIAAVPNLLRTFFAPAVLLALMIGIVGAAVGPASGVARAAAGVRVAGYTVTGMSEDEIVALLDSHVANRAVNVEVGNESFHIPLSQAGVVVDTRATAQAVINTPSPAPESLTTLFGMSVDVPLVTEIDTETPTPIMAQLDAALNNSPTDAVIHVTAPSSSFQTQPGQSGQRVDPNELTTQVRAALVDAAPNHPIHVTLTPRHSDPEVTTLEAREAARLANTWITKEVSLSVDDRTWTADPQTKSSWVKILTIDGRPTVSVDHSKVRAWVDSVASKAQRNPVSAVSNVAPDGTLLEPVRPGRSGLRPGGQDVATTAIVSSLLEGKGWTGNLGMLTVIPPTEKRIVPAGPERFAYHAGPHEKWIDVNLSDRTLTAYVGTQQVHGPINMNDGGPGHATVEGTFRIYHKMAVQDLGCSAEYDWCVKSVPWISYFDGDFAIHGAPWAHTFGLDSGLGSHGCVNLPVEEAKWVFDWAPEGTVVVSHR